VVRGAAVAGEEGLSGVEVVVTVVMTRTGVMTLTLLEEGVPGEGEVVPSLRSPCRCVVVTCYFQWLSRFWGLFCE